MSFQGGVQPLKAVWYHLLVAIAEGNEHGYAMRKVVEDRTAGGIRLWPTTLYGALRDMEQRGLVKERVEESSSDSDSRRRCYGLTPSGERALADETRRLEKLVRLARATPALQRGDAE